MHSIGLPQASDEGGAASHSRLPPRRSRWRQVARPALRRATRYLTALAFLALIAWGLDRVIAGPTVDHAGCHRALAVPRLSAPGVSPSPAQRAPGRTFYVSPIGDDRSTGTSPGRAWRSIARVNNTTLRPGDTVLFRGGAVFGGTPLYVTRSGSSGGWISYGGYGCGMPTLSDGLYLETASWIQVTGLRLANTSQGIESTGTGSGVHHLLVSRNLITSVGIGINSPNPRDGSWVIVANTISDTRDSGLILQGGHMEVIDNRILNTGVDRHIPYGTHGVYSKGPYHTIVANLIQGFRTEGISTRYNGAVIAGNIIADGEGGIGYYRDGPALGRTVISDNRIRDVDYGIYVSSRGPAGRTEEQFVISGNAIERAKEDMDVPENLVRH